MNPAQVRKDFPILDQQVHGKPLVYLDNAATTQKPRAVIDAITRYYEKDNAAVHRAIHELGARATDAYEGARAKVAKFIGAPSERNIIFVKNASEAVNLVAYAWGRRSLRAGDEILVSRMEHHSNLIPWQELAKATGAQIRYIDLTPDGRLDMDDFEAKLTPKTRVLAVTHASNVLGTVVPVKTMSKMARKVGAVVLVDGAQSAPHMPVNVQDLDCDFFAFSGHKMCGPTGIGVLYGKSELLDVMDPFLYGGSMITSVDLEGAQWHEVPWRFEAGVPNMAGAVGLGAAIDYLESIGMEQIWQHEQSLLQYTVEALQQIDGLTMYGPSEGERTGLVAFNLDDVHPHDIATVLDQEGVAIRAGHHCAQPVMEWLDVPATARASFYVYNTTDDIDALVRALRKTKEFFSHGT